MKRTYWIAWGSEGLCGFWAHSHSVKGAIKVFKAWHPNEEPKWVGQWLFHRKVERVYDLSGKIISERSLERKNWDPEGSHKYDWFHYPAGWRLNDAHRHPQMKVRPYYEED